jgi:alginate O-acetyltransferase complex protein AlgI
MNFFLASAYGMLHALGLGMSERFLQVALPLGISFYTFETISYIVDVYQRKTQAVRSLLDYSLYIMFFPHLIAGPIVRPRDFLPQLRTPKRFNWNRLQVGLQFFALGFFKKAVIADHLATVADAVFGNPTAYGSAATWLGVVAYAVQIYCDFSGYSDMAVGVAHLFGYKLPRNFDMPYFAASITEFWRRWHISLSSWLRDYLYIPLGGSRCGRLNTYRNLILTMLLGGLWHGANWTFVVWGLYHGALLALHKAVTLPAWMGKAAFRPVAVLATFGSVCIGWVFFRAQSFADVWAILARMFAPVTTGKVIHPSAAAIAVAFLLVALAGHLIGTCVDLRRLERRLPASVLGAWLAAMVLAALLLMPMDSKAFIYFTF